MNDIDTRGAIPVEGAPEDMGFDLRGAEPVRVEEPGFFTSVKRGFEQAKGGFAALKGAGSADMLGKLETLEREGDSENVRKMAEGDLLFANHYNRWKIGKGDPAILQELKAQELGGVATNMQKVEQAAANTQLLPADPAMQKFQQSQGTKEALGNFAAAPLTVTKEIVGESLGGQGPGMPLAIGAGLAAGPAGLALGSGASSFMAEAGGGTLELLAQAGIDPRDTEAVARFMNSPEFKLDQANKMRKAAVIGAVDAATAGMAGVKLGATAVKNVAAQTGLQMAGGAGGEIAGSLIGAEEVNPVAVLSEMIGEIPGGAMDTTTLAARKVLGSKGLQHAAVEKEKEALTGLNTVQEEVVADIVKTVPKPRLTPVQTKVFQAALAAGVDPATALTIMQIESGGDPAAKNPTSSAHGLMQLLDSTWEAYGGGDRNNVDQQIANGLRFVADVQGKMSAELGRAATVDEVYMGHLFGPRGGATALRAAADDPQGSFLETVKRWDAKNAEAIVNNNGLKGLTNEQATAKIFGMVQRKRAAVGFHDEQNVRTSARGDMPPVEDVTGETQARIDAAMEDLDAMFAELDDVKLTPEIIKAAETEESLGKAESDPATVADAALLNGETAAAEPGIVGEVAEPSPVLPRDLAGAAPRYGFGKVLFEIQFANDLDRAAYVIADGAKRSSRDAEYLQFVMKHKGFNEEQARAYGKEVRAEVKEMARAGRNGEERVLIYGDRKRAESWVSIDENRNRANYENPNDDFIGRVQKAPIVAGAADAEGLTIEDRPIKPGEVIALGVDSEHTPKPVMQAAQSALQDVIARFAPTARIALTFFTEPGDVVSSYNEPGVRQGYGTRNRQSRAAGLYRINMRNLTNFGKTDSGSRNTDAQRKFTYGMYHEAGHVITSEQMVRGMSPELRFKFENLGRDEYFTDEELATLDIQQAAVLREYNDLKWRVLNDPNFTGEQFAEAWLSPWKLGHALANTKTRRPGIFQFARKFLGESTAQSLQGPARLLALAMEARVPEVLTPHEYMAEQFARYAYTNKLAEHSSLGAWQFFKQALATLREFFQGLKRGGDVRPGVAFAEWVDSLTETAAVMRAEAEAPAPVRAAAERKPKPRIKPKTTSPKSLADAPSVLPPSPVAPKEVQKVVSKEYSADQNEALVLLATNLRFVAKDDPKKYDHWMQLVRQDRLDDLKSDIAIYIDDDFVKEKVRFDRDPQTELGFVAWFKGSKIVDAQGKPLRLYHGTTKNIEAFEGNHQTEKDAGWYGRGIYFTADPTTASAYTGFEEMQGKGRNGNPNVLPVYLSIKNPYVWPKGRQAATTLRESIRIRQELEAAGYDGVVVPNEYADPQFAKHYEVIAFRPAQIKSATGNNGDFNPADERIRFDRDVPDLPEWREIELGLDSIVPKRSGMKRWLGAGMGRLRNAQWFTWTSRQLAAKYPEVVGVQVIDKLHTNYKAFKAQLELPGIEAVQKALKLGKEQAGLLQQAMREEHARGAHFSDLQLVNHSWRFVANEELARYAAAKGLDPETVEVWLDMKNAHMRHMMALKNALMMKLKARLEGKPATLAKKAAELNQLFEHIRTTPFLPQTRFGEFAVHVKEQGVEGERIVHVEFFETAIARDEALAKLKKAAGPDRKVTAANYNTSSAILRTLPPQILGTWGEELQLTELEKKELRQIADAITMSPQLRKYSSQLAGITGANKDLFRNFAEFMWHNAGNIAKVHYREHFQRALLQIEAEKIAAGQEGDVAWHDELTKMVAFYKRRIGHILNPVDEYQAVRTFVVVKQLWGNVKTALANLTAMKDVWATAAAQQGWTRGTWETNRQAMKVFADSLRKTGQRIMGQPVRGGEVFAEDTRWAMDQAYKDGLISETFAAQLGHIANAGVLGRLGFANADSKFKQAVWLGMLPQHIVETYVRRVSLVTQFEYYLKQGMDRNEAYGRARKDTFLTQGDNTLSNRPEVALGKAANFLIYFGFLQNQLYLLSGAKERSRRYTEAWENGLMQGMTHEQGRAKYYRISPFGGETMKTWMAYAFLGGAMGMPGAEDLDNALELIAKKLFGARFSLREHAYALAAEIAENASSIGLDINPRSLVHGTFADFDAFGLLPAVDLSMSTGLGNAIPGLGGLGEAGQRNGNFVIEAMGPLGGVLKQLNDTFSDDPGMLKKLGFVLPNTVSGMAKAVMEWEKGVLAPNGGRVTIDRETGEVRDLTTGENLARLMMFTPEIISANREVHWMQRDVQVYWTTRRNNTVTQYFEAIMHGDREAEADARAALSEFNEDAPPKLRIGAKELRKAVKRKRKAAAMQEAGLGSAKRFRDSDAEIRDDIMGWEEE